MKNRLVLLASMLTVSCLAPLQAAYCAPDQNVQNYLNSLGTTQLGAGPSFSQQLALTMAGQVSFNWKTTVPNTTAGKWTVADKATGTPLATGFVEGTGAEFKINFAKIAPPEVPEASAAMIYYVRVAPVNAAHQGLAAPSNVVKVVYCQPK